MAGAGDPTLHPEGPNARPASPLCIQDLARHRSSRTLPRPMNSPFPLGRCFAFFAALPLAAFSAAPTATAPIEGLRDATPRVHALVGARIVVSPTQTIAKGTVVLRDGVIEAVGADLPTPPDARIWDVSGRTIYAGFIEAESTLFLPAAWKGGSASGARRASSDADDSETPA